MHYTSPSHLAVVDWTADLNAPPVVMLPCAIATDTTLGCAVAQAFARAGWDICVYFDVRLPAERAGAEHCCASVASFGRRAVALPTDIAGLGHPSGASALISRCADSREGLGCLPRCLINAPAEIDSDILPDTPMRIADGDVAPNADGTALLRLTEVNVAPVLTLSAAFHRAWMQVLASASAVTLHPDLSIINLIDSATADALALPGSLPDRLAFMLTQASVRAATPVLAKRFAPRVRVAGVSTPLVPVSVADEVHSSAHASNVKSAQAPDLTVAMSDAMLFLANASTTTGAFLLVDGGAHVDRAARDKGAAPGAEAACAATAEAGCEAGATALATRKSVASTSDPASEIVADPHRE